MLALFASAPYSPPASTLQEDAEQDLSSHLTNTCLQSEEEADKSVFLLSDLRGKSILDEHGDVIGTISQDQIDRVIKRIGEVIGETFAAGLGMPNHFTVCHSPLCLHLQGEADHALMYDQVAENAFEVFGVDIMLSTPSSPSPSTEIAVHLLEINACPDFRQSGAGLHSVIENLFQGVLQIAVKPCFVETKEEKEEEESWKVGQRKGSWLKCLDEKVRRVARPW